VLAADTNILIRLLVRDEPAQARRAAALFERERVFIPKTVLLECAWVLRHSYGLSRPATLGALRRVAGLPQVEVEDARQVALAFGWSEAGMDFADALHLASSSGADGFATFDQALTRKARALKAARIVE
jgi:predicted nucleic-acid-binding protein